MEEKLKFIETDTSETEAGYEMLRFAEREDGEAHLMLMAVEAYCPFETSTPGTFELVVEWPYGRPSDTQVTVFSDRASASAAFDAALVG
jgi:hypothetical protein